MIQKSLLQVSPFGVLVSFFRGWRSWSPVGVRLQRLEVAIILIVAAGVMLATSPVDGDFWWQDAPRHALNGAFVKDFIKELPWRDPVTWAKDYYLKYPSLTILFYPPLFYAIEALLFSVFGVSHLIAQLTVTLFVLLLGVASYRLGRMYLPRWSALGVALLMMGSPENALWGRQVMLDIPMQATLVASVFAFSKYLQNHRGVFLYGGASLLVAALYIKLTAIFIVPVLVLALLMARGITVLRDWKLHLTAIIGLAASIPGILLSLKFGSVNVQNVTGSVGTGLSLTDPRAWQFYAQAMPHQLGIVPTALGAVGFVLLICRSLGRPFKITGFLEKRPSWQTALMFTWFTFGYLFFSAIAVREVRHDLSILFPVGLCAALALRDILPRQTAQAITLTLGLLTMVYTICFVPVPVIHGYQEIAAYVAAKLPPNGIVAFSGYRDGNFVFDMRSHAERGDVTILRVDKLLLRMAVTRDWGVQQTDLDNKQISALLKENGVAMIVVQRGFWTDLRQMSRFYEVIGSSDFITVARFDVSGNFSSNDGDPATGHNTIDILEPTYSVSPPAGGIDIDMPFINSHFHGSPSSRAK